MKSKTQITVLKFSSSVLRSGKDLSSVVHEIYRAWREGEHGMAIAWSRLDLNEP